MISLTNISKKKKRLWACYRRAGLTCPRGSFELIFHRKLRDFLSSFHYVEENYFTSRKIQMKFFRNSNLLGIGDQRPPSSVEPIIM
jgi:hypothetical protein